MMQSLQFDELPREIRERFHRIKDKITARRSSCGRIFMRVKPEGQPAQTTMFAEKLVKCWLTRNTHAVTGY